jgi:hypothetical protein
MYQLLALAVTGISDAADYYTQQDASLEKKCSSSSLSLSGSLELVSSKFDMADVF